MSPSLRAIHLASLAVYLLSTLWMVAVVAVLAGVRDPADRRRRLVRHLRPYNVLSVGAIGALIISGASALTDLKALYGPAYVRLLWPLAGKLTLTFFLTMAATYVSFGLAHRLVRAEQGRLPIDLDQFRSMLGRLRGGLLLALALALWTAWSGYRLARLPVAGPVAAEHVASP